MTLDPEILNPGPGAYHEPTSNKISKFANITYGTSKSNRFVSAGIFYLTLANGVPGAGSYKNI
jgi:hypothetical protein